MSNKKDMKLNSLKKITYILVNTVTTLKDSGSILVIGLSDNSLKR